MSLLPNSNAIETGGYTISRSLRNSRAASTYMSYTSGSTITNQNKWTLSTWIKRGQLGVFEYFLSAYSGSSDTGYIQIAFRTTDTLMITGFNTYWLETTQVFRDPTAWYHIVIAVDTTLATANNRVRLYVNGSEVTAFAQRNNPTQNQTMGVNTPSALNRINSDTYISPGNYFDGYFADYYFIDGQQLTPSSFGETSTTTGAWIPKKYAGTYGSNGWYLPFSNVTSTTTLGYDSSGNSHNFTLTNYTLTGTSYCSVTDVPTLTSATASNFATLNPLDKYASMSMTNGNLTITNDGGSGSWWTTRSTIWISSGKWYWESTIGGSQYSVVGVAGPNQPTFTNDRWVGYTSDSYGYYGANGNKVNNNSSTGYGSSYTAGDVIGVALDMDAGTLVFYKNGVSQGTAFTGLSGLVSPGFSVNDQGTNPYQDVNFGQRPFTYTTAGSNRPASTFLALNTFNLPTPTIKQGNLYMDATLYTGNGATINVTNTQGFQPGLVWTKSYSNAGQSHLLTDVARGNGNALYSQSTSSQTTRGCTINSNGFSYTYPNEGGDGNYSGYGYVGWQWKANGATVSNTSGSITSNVSANTTAGFSVVRYTGTGSAATIGHGLGVAPKMIIVKSDSRSDVGWAIYHINDSDTPNNGYLLLNSTGSFTADSQVWNNTAPTSSVFSVGNLLATNGSGSTYVGYCWAAITGYSAFGKYLGNGSSTDGPFIYLGFRARYVMFKSADVSAHWIVYDTSRSTYNPVNNELSPDSATSQNGTISSGDNFDILANGIKLRGVVGNDFNVNGYTYIYAAFAENPFNYSNAR